MEEDKGDSGDARIAFKAPPIQRKKSVPVLVHMVKLAEEATGESVESAVITVPAYFNNLQRQLPRCGRNSGLKVLENNHEPTAAAMAYGYEQNQNHCRCL